MKTIAIWYEPKKEVVKDENEILDIHINFWKLKKKQLFKESDYLLDIGFMIFDIKSVNKFNVHFPFKITKENISDLGSILHRDHKYVNSVFNENYDLHSSPEAAKQKSVQDNNGKCLFNIYALDISKNSTDVELKDIFEGTILSIITSSIKPYQECNKYYFRIRLKGDFLKNFIKEHEPKNWFFQSAFTSTDAIDFRINEKRNFQDSLAEEISSNKLFSVKSIHFLLMRNAPDDIIADHLKLTCRELEPKLWDIYVGKQYKLENMIAYHWSEKGDVQNKKFIDSFNTLVKIKYHKSNLKTIILYILVIGLLSISFNLASSYIKDYFDDKSKNSELAVIEKYKKLLENSKNSVKLKYKEMKDLKNGEINENN